MQAPSPIPGRLRIAAHVRACFIDGQVILLDLQRNRYLGIGGRHAEVLGHAVDGWPVDLPVQPGPIPPSVLEAATRPLKSQGLLTDRAVERADETLGEAAIAIDADDVIDAARVGPRRVYRMLQSAAAAAVWLRFRSLHAIAAAVVARRTRLATGAPGPTSVDGMRDAVAAYASLRPLVFSVQDRCLHDSLTMVGFLAHEGIHPRWVIGVQTRPFGAHSWVQIGGIVLNDEPDRVRKFRPLLVV